MKNKILIITILISNTAIAQPSNTQNLKAEIQRNFDQLVETYKAYINNINEIVTVRAHQDGTIGSIAKSLKKLGDRISELKENIYNIDKTLQIQTPEIASKDISPLLNLYDNLNASTINIRDYISTRKEQIINSIATDVQSYFIDNFRVLFNNKTLSVNTKDVFKTLTTTKQADIITKITKDFAARWAESKSNANQIDEATTQLKDTITIMKNLQSIQETAEAKSKIQISINNLEKYAIQRMNSLEQKFKENLNAGNDKVAEQQFQDLTTMMTDLTALGNENINNAVQLKVTRLSTTKGLSYSDNIIIRGLQKILDTLGLGNKARKQFQNTQDNLTADLNRIDETTAGQTVVAEEGGETTQTGADQDPDADLNHGYEEDFEPYAE